MEMEAWPDTASVFLPQSHMDQSTDHALPSFQTHWQMVLSPPGLGTCSFHPSALTAVEAGFSPARGRRQKGSPYP